YHHYDVWPGRAVTPETEPELTKASIISNRKRGQQDDSAHGIIHRAFTAEQWEGLIDPSLWKECRKEAYAAIDLDAETDLQGYDIDPQAVEVAKIAAREAGVEEMVHFQVRDVADLSHRKKYGFLITNPPYGERLGTEDEKTLFRLYQTLGERYRSLEDWSLYLITSYPDAERAIGRKSDKNRKLYNGMIETRFYQYFGAKPPRRTAHGST
ncbi:MAG: methyltransferase, partial [Lachnospiraceae bacterium]|nr:methyltransferase [Lachnospiraceae bacterium]